jgi:hypothetical protein
LNINECPLIREKYKKEGGERWHTISHIPDVNCSSFVEMLKKEVIDRVTDICLRKIMQQL